MISSQDAIVAAIASGILVALSFIAGYLVGKAVGMVQEWHDYEHQDDDGT